MPVEMGPHQENEPEIDPAARKSSKIIDTMINALRTIADVAQQKGTLQEIAVSEIMRAEQLEGQEAAQKLARYLEDDINIWNFSENEKIDEGIKHDALEYLKEYQTKSKNNPDKPERPWGLDAKDIPDFDTP